jgi:hypothetical protein
MNTSTENKLSFLKIRDNLFFKFLIINKCTEFPGLIFFKCIELPFLISKKKGYSFEVANLEKVILE